MSKKGLLYKLECAIGNRYIECGKLNLTVAWYGVSINWRGLWVLSLTRQWPFSNNPQLEPNRRPALVFEVIYRDYWQSWKVINRAI